LLPAELSLAITSGALSPTAALAAWLNQAEQDTSDSALKRHVYELRRLATSIEQHGLINPITLRRPRPEESLVPEVEYLIVTGERRYWSHVLLALEKRQVHDGAEVGSPEQIKALLSNEGISIRAHQLIENLMREDINAVEKARGMWALRYELSGVNHGSPLASTPGQVNHGSPSQGRVEETLVPWSQVEEMLDISKRYRIFVTSVLNLNEEAQQLVIRHNLSERLIRPIVQKLKERPELQVEVLKRLITHREAGDNEPDQPAAELVGGLVEQLLARVTVVDTPGGAPVRNATPGGKRLTSGAEQFRSRVQGALRFLNQLEEPDLVGLTQDLATTQEYTHVVEELRDLRERIDTILEAVNIYSSQHS
jgi:ParB-like chromosome segregation protein Spo0J